MSKITILLSVITGSLIVYEDVPLHVLFGFIFAGLMLELNRIEKKLYPIVSNIILSSIIGWVFASGLKHYKPELFIGGIKIVSIFVTTIFSYVTVLYTLKNELVQKFIEKYFNKKNDTDTDN